MNSGAKDKYKVPRKSACNGERTSHDRAPSDARTDVQTSRRAHIDDVPSKAKTAPQGSRKETEAVMDLSRSGRERRT